MYTVTLKSLRDIGACFGGYNKLVSGLMNFRGSASYSEYMECDHDEPILLSEIFEINGLHDAIWVSRHVFSEIDLQSFALAIARMYNGVKWEKADGIISLVENYMNGSASYAELSAVRKTLESLLPYDIFDCHVRICMSLIDSIQAVTLDTCCSDNCYYYRVTDLIEYLVYVDKENTKRVGGLFVEFCNKRIANLVD